MATPNPAPDDDQNDLSTLEAAPKFLSLSSSHGFDMATVMVGKEGSQKVFRIHTNLLAQSSPFLERALNGNFKESSDSITLSNHHPWAFEVLYQYLYSGKMDHAVGLIESEVYSSTHSADRALLWLRCFKLADETRIQELKVHAYEQLTLKGLQRPPGPELVKELFDTEASYPLLQRYFTHIAALQIIKLKAMMPLRWEGSWKDVSLYRDMVLRQLVELSSNGSIAAMGNPWNDPKYSVVNVCGS